ncbi:site-specific integrase [Clostridiaceae bacterium M8S5]|nr:site-specific integrase [Clostridiaceae bacterium M8S5]
MILLIGGVRKRGKKWYYYYNVNGKRVERVSGTSKLEAQKKLKEALQGQEYNCLTPSKVTVYMYLNEWLENYIKEYRKINTYNRYRSILNNNVYPNIGKIKLKNLEPIHIDMLITAEKKKGLSSTTLQNIYGVISSAFNRAVKLRIINENVCKYVDRPKRDRFIANVLSIEDYCKIIDSLDLSKYNDYIFYVALQIVMELGLRRGEIAGLKWCDIDFNNNTIYVNNNLVYSHGKTYYSTTKTRSSDRLLYISDNLKQILLKHKERLEIDCEFVMSWENGKILHPNYYTQKFSYIVKKIGFIKRLRFHDIRHTNATMLISQNENIKIIQARLGHSDISTTLNIYSHVDIKMQKSAIDKLSRKLSSVAK